MTVLDRATWQQAQRHHEEQVDLRVHAHLARRHQRLAHPVEDFLFTYYRLRPAGLRRWHPGLGTRLAGADDHATWRWYQVAKDATCGVDLAAFLADRARTVLLVRDILTGTLDRPPVYSCFGLHEWAMVYQVPEGGQRHESWPLRLGSSGTDAVVTGAQLRCTHFDAFRFFTEPAQPRNRHHPTRADVADLEQSGCVHATMDLYKYAYQLGPLVPGDLLLSCFDLARTAREVDMRASPYDLADLGYPPIRIETPTGRAEYVTEQTRLRALAEPLRTRLLSVCRTALA